MKKRNREEVYTSSTRSTPRGKRLLSWLLSMVMLLSLLPGMELHAHAAYEDGMECPGCGEYHWDENCCGNCGACTRECDDDCYEETHCINDCGACRADGNFACDCGYCYDCAKELEPDKHCDYCGEEDDGGICSECGLRNTRDQFRSTDPECFFISRVSPSGSGVPSALPAAGHGKQSGSRHHALSLLRSIAHRRWSVDPLQRITDRTQLMKLTPRSV